MTDATDSFQEDLLGKLEQGFDSEIGLALLEVTPDQVTGEFTVVPKLHQPYGIVHGGVYCAVIESIASVSGAVWINATGVKGAQVVGVNNSTDFLRAVSEGTMTARSKPIHRGRRQQLWEVDITDENNKLIAQGRVRLQNIEPQS